MARSARLKTRSEDPSALKNLLQETHDQALQQNDNAVRHWLKIRDEHLSLLSHLKILPNKLSQEVMVPVGSKALIRGKMVHTNEILVCLGDGWFVKCSAKQSEEICERRIKLCENMLKDLEKERDLLTNRKQIPLQEDAFGAEDREEIMEPYDEEKEAQWKVEHREKEKGYRKKLTELKTKEKTVIENEESLWKRLDELELQEELEEELDRLHAESGDNEEEDQDDDDDDDDDDEDEEEEEDEESEDSYETKPIVALDDSSRNDLTRAAGEIGPDETGKQKSGRRVSFADEKNPFKESDCDSDSSAETLKIDFHHTVVETEVRCKKSPDDIIQSPGDIHNYIKDMILKDVAPKSILKNKINLHYSGETGSIGSASVFSHEEVGSLSDDTKVDDLEDITENPPLVVGDVIERVVEQPLQFSEPSTEKRPTSRFKAARMAARR